jgi:hypothetical protein
MIKKAFILLLLSFSAAIAGRAQQQQPLTPEKK